MKITHLIIAVLIVCSSNARIYAATQTNPTNQVLEKGKSESEYQKIIDAYKKHLTQVKKNVKEEIIKFREEIAQLNKQKKEKYKYLSQEAQAYLAKEQQFKKKLPLKYRKNINISQDDTSNVNNQVENKGESSTE